MNRTGGAPPRGWGTAREALGVLAGALLLLAALFLLEGSGPSLRGDQQWGNLMALKHLHPDWLAGDVFYGPPYFRGYNPAFFSLQAWVARVGGLDLEGALRVLAWPIGLLFLLGHYALFRYLTGSPLAAALGVVSALTIRHSLGGEYWGFAGVRDVLPRSIASGLTPLLILALLRLRRRPFFAAYFLLLGAIANLHPVSGLHLAQISAVAHLWLSRFRPRAWLDVLIGVPLFTIGALPFVVRYLPAQENVRDPALLPVVTEALHYRYPYLLYPLDAASLVSVGLHAALPVGMMLWVARRSKASDDLRLLLTIATAALVLGLGGTALIQGIGAWLHRPYVDIHQLRATRFMYAGLLAAFPLAFAVLLRRRTVPAWGLVGIILILSAVPPEAVIHSFSPERRDAVKSALGIAVSAPPASPVADAGAGRAEQDLWEFVKRETGRNALFLTDSFAFRYETLRPITGSFKDGGIIIAGTAPFYRWYVYMREVEACRRRHGDGCWFALAEKYRARYAVVDPALDRAVSPDGGWAPAWAEAGWSVWRRRAGG